MSELDEILSLRQQLKAARSSRSAVIEECARVADEMASKSYSRDGYAIAAAIRALQE